MKEAIEELAREQAKSQAEKRMREKFGIPENNLANAMKTLIDAYGRSNEMFAKIKKLAKQMPCKPRIKVSPYAKFGQVSP